MERVVKGYKPAKVFEYFEDICAIPHGSGNEKGVADYIVNFVKAHGFEYRRDRVNNMFIRKPASAGYENVAPIMLQGHMDMVCEKNSDTVHDFEHDGLELYIENGWLRAKGTTLGGDDGIAVAIMLAILDGEIENHPEIECLFTVEEETGLLGATEFDYSQLHSRRMLNLDSEEEDVVTVGCAGGVRTDITIEKKEKVYAENTVTVSIKGLCGGHSGTEINRGRANANKLMGRLLSAGAKVCDIKIVSVDGGSKDNAIPRECTAVVACSDSEKFSHEVARVAALIGRELTDDDACFVCNITESGEAFAFDKKDSLSIISILNCTANGVLAMNCNIEGLVEFSRNMGVVRTDNDKISFTFSSRSATESMIDSSVNELENIASVCGGKCQSYARYPGWSYKKDSSLREDYLEAYRQVFGKSPEVTVIHAGLECGIISSHLPDMDMISIGPNMTAIHSPDEALELASCERLFAAVKKVIEKK